MFWVAMCSVLQSVLPQPQLNAVCNKLAKTVRTRLKWNKGLDILVPFILDNTTVAQADIYIYMRCLKHQCIFFDIVLMNWQDNGTRDSFRLSWVQLLFPHSQEVKRWRVNRATKHCHIISKSPNSRSKQGNKKGSSLSLWEKNIGYKSWLWKLVWT